MKNYWLEKADVDKNIRDELLGEVQILWAESTKGFDFSADASYGGGFTWTSSNYGSWTFVDDDLKASTTWMEWPRDD
jgi:hypothetical protein